MIEMKKGFLQNPKELSLMASKFAIITDDNVASLYGKALQAFLLEAGLEAFLFSFPPGEAYKTRGTKERLEDSLLEKKLGVDTCVIGLGGGVVTDVAGYLAATYCRGLPLILIPTSLLAMVDACMGGKNGVNHPLGKNLIGSNLYPLKIYLDPNVLNTLPIKELRTGVVEMIKHGLIEDPNYFSFLENHTLESLPLEKAIEASCQIKTKIVQESKKEPAKRHLLNFGHTVGHALEHLSNYALTHGEAVAIGLIVESHLANNLGLLSVHSFKRIHKILAQYALPLRTPPFSIKDLLETMSFDKKSVNGRPRFVLLQEIGSPKSCSEVAESSLIDSLNWMRDALSCH